MPPVSSTMQALNAAPEAEPLPLELLLELDGLLPHAVSTRAIAAALESTAPVRFICTDSSSRGRGTVPTGPRRRPPRDAPTGGALLIADPRRRPLRSANVSRSLWAAPEDLVPSAPPRRNPCVRRARCPPSTGPRCGPPPPTPCAPPTHPT